MLEELTKELRSYANPEKAAFFPRFFKAGPGEYGEGDLFLGITVPDCRKVVKKFRDLDLKDIEKLLHSKWHEERLVALLILTNQFPQADANCQKNIYKLYLQNTRYINNWDLVDSSSRDIVGGYIYTHPELLNTFDKLAASPLIWDRRIAVISTFYFIQKGDPQPTVHLANVLINDTHDLIQKAVGWMLREVGKRIDRQLLIDFLAVHYKTMPRTTLRYAIEHFDATTRKKYLNNLI